MCYLTDLAYALQPNENYNRMFLYYYLMINNEQIKTKVEKNGPRNINSSKLLSIFVPNISIAHQEEIVELLDRLYKTYKIDDTVKYLSSANVFNLLINRQYQDFESILWYKSKYPA